MWSCPIKHPMRRARQSGDGWSPQEYCTLPAQLVPAAGAAEATFLMCPNAHDVIAAMRGDEPSVIVEVGTWDGQRCRQLRPRLGGV